MSLKFFVTIFEKQQKKPIKSIICIFSPWFFMLTHETYWFSQKKCFIFSSWTTTKKGERNEKNKQGKFFDFSYFSCELYVFLCCMLNSNCDSQYMYAEMVNNLWKCFPFFMKGKENSLTWISTKNKFKSTSLSQHLTSFI